MKIGRWVVTLSLVAALLVGCGGGSDQGADTAPQRLKSFSFTLEGYPDAENVGVLMADQEGYFAEAGFEVDVFHPVDSDNVPGYLAEGGDDFGLLPQPEVVMSRARGMPLVAIGSLVQKPTMGLIWPRKSKIHGVADLEGKTIAINGFPFEEGFVEALLAQAGLKPGDVKVKSVSYELVPALVKGRADAILGSGNIEGIELEARGLKPVVTPLQRLGIPSYEELVMVTRRSRLAGNQPWIRRFMSAVARGTAAAVEDPEAAAEAIIAARKRLELPAAAPKLVKAKVEATLPLLAGSAHMSIGRAAHLMEWMREQELIQRQVPVSELLTNGYLP
jgi:putative hydroxymethylpyrimidine transport system substrate-binding protein